MVRPSTGALRAPAQGEENLLMALRKTPHPERARSAQSKDAQRSSRAAVNLFLVLECAADDIGFDPTKLWTD
jgi:hypothetical protein